MGSCGCTKPKCSGGCTAKTEVTVQAWACGDAVKAGSLIVHNCLLYLALEDHPLGDKEPPTTSDHFTKAISLSKAIELIAASFAGGAGVTLASGSYDPITNLLTLTNSDATSIDLDLTSLIADAIASANHANLNGDPAEVFEVANAVAATDATNLGQVNALILAAIAGIGTDVFVNGWTGYDPVTNMLEITLNDGSTHAVDLTSLLADAAASANHAELNGDAAQNFSVATSVAGTDAVNQDELNAAIIGAGSVTMAMVLSAIGSANHADINGDNLQNFSVANASALDQAVSLQQLNDSIGIPDWVAGNAHHLVMGSDGNAYRLPQGGDPTIDPVGAPLFAWRTLDNTSTRNDIQWVYPLVAAPYAQYTGPGAGPITWVAYARSLAGVVSMQGFVRRLNTGSTDDLVFTLPVGYRPEVIIDVPVVVELDGRTIMRVYPSGAVHIRADFGWHGGDPLTFVAMDITFQASN